MFRKYTLRKIRMFAWRFLAIHDDDVTTTERIKAANAIAEFIYSGAIPAKEEKRR